MRTGAAEYRQHLGIIIAVAIAASIYSTSLGFVWDDKTHIINNEVIQNFRNVSLVFKSDDGLGTGRDNPYYRPLTTMSFMFDYLIWKNNPWGFHVTSIIIHLLVCCGVYCVTRFVAGGATGALVAGLLFSVHPVHAEPVAYISARADLIAAFFMLLSFGLFVSYDQRRKGGLLVLSLLAFLCSLASKIMGLTLPLLILLYELQFSRSDWKTIVKNAAWFAAVAVVFMLLRAYILEKESWDDGRIQWRFLTSPSMIIRYIGMLVFPLNLKVFYDVPIQKTLFNAAVLVPAGLCLMFLAGLTAIHRKDKEAAFGLSWIFITILPVSGLCGLIYPALIANRYLYIPSIGLSIAAGVMWMRIISRIDREVWRKSAQTAGVAVLMLLGLGNTYRISEWSDPLKLWTEAAKDAPRSTYVLNRLGVVHLRAGRIDAARRVFTDAIKLGQNDPALYNNLGMTYYNTGDLETARHFIQQALNMHPNFADALHNIGLVFVTEGDIDKAVSFLARAVELDPYNDEAQALLSAIMNAKADMMKRSHADVRADRDKTEVD